MTMLRAVVLAAAFAASGAALAQQDASDVSPPLRPAVMAYRAGDLGTAEATFRSMAASNADAEAWLGAVLLDRGLARDGLRHVQRAAEAGSSEGAHRLAIVYAQGLAGTPRDEARALQLFERAASAGHTRAQINLGILYLRGLGVQRDVVNARAWLEKAAASGDPQALYTLGRAMDEGSEQVAPDPVRAAENGHVLAGLR